MASEIIKKSMDRYNNPDHSAILWIRLMEFINEHRVTIRNNAIIRCAGENHSFMPLYFCLSLYKHQTINKTGNNKSAYWSFLPNNMRLFPGSIGRIRI
jgi:hypothetical protein